MPSLRPTFVIDTDLEPSEIIRAIKSTVEEHRESITGQFTSHHATLSIVKPQRHFWSPFLNLEIRKNETEEGKPYHLFGRFSPHPSIWTAVMLAYTAIGTMAFFASVLGLSQQLSRQPVWGYYLLIPLLTIAILLWLVSQMGQRLAWAEMHQMKKALTDRLGEEADR